MAALTIGGDFGSQENTIQYLLLFLYCKKFLSYIVHVLYFSTIPQSWLTIIEHILQLNDNWIAFKQNLYCDKRRNVLHSVHIWPSFQNPF